MRPSQVEIVAHKLIWQPTPGPVVNSVRAESYRELILQGRTVRGQLTEVNYAEAKCRASIIPGEY